MTNVNLIHYPVSAPGYVDTPGRAGNYIYVGRPALTAPIDTIEWIVRFRSDDFAPLTLLGWGSSGAASLVIDTNLKVTMLVPGASGPIGNHESAIFPNLFPNLDVWVKVKLTVATALTEYYYSYDAVDPVWKTLGSFVGTNPGTAVTLASTTPFNIGASATGGPTPFDGRIYFVQENINGVTKLRFDGNTDLHGVVPEATSFPITNSGDPTTPATSTTPAVYAPATVVRDASTPKLLLIQPTLDRPWWPLSNDPDPDRWYRYPAFTVQREVKGIYKGGDYTRGSTNTLTEKTALRFPATVFAPGVIQGKGILYTRVYDYETVEIEWGLPEKFTENWYRVAIVRSAFGYPITVTDGQAIYNATKSEVFPTGSPTSADGSAAAVMLPKFYDMVAPPHGSLKGLPSGYWYYYSLFFQAGRRWYRSMVSSSLVPRDYGHAEHLWDALPPYYRWVDDQQRDEGGDLRRFFRIFGFDLDTTREFVESWQKLYWIDFAPMRLVRRLGPNFGVPYEAGIGDIRYRALLSNIGHLYSIRGTTSCLERVITAVSKCESEVLGSSNLLLLPDDSDFFEGTGNWAGIHPDTPLSVGRLEPTAGTVSTPDTASDPPTSDFVVKVKVKVIDPTEPFKIIATQSASPTVGLSWAIGMSGDKFSLRVSSNGSSWKTTENFGTLTADQMYAGNVVTIACACDVDNGASGHTITTYMLLDGRWLYLGSMIVPGTLALFAPTSVPITVGGQPSGTSYNSRIYWAELRSGLNPDAGTLVWRFDPDDYNTGVGGTQDPRGRAWTLSNSGAVTQSITYLSPEKVAFQANSVQQVPPPNANGRIYGRGTASMWTDKTIATTDVLLTIGDGIAYPMKTNDPETTSVDESLEVDTTQPRYVMPRETGIHVYPQGIYGFSVWLKHELVTSHQDDIWLMWFSAQGQPDDLISVSKDGLVAPANTNWAQRTVQGTAPEGAVFCVPAVRLHSRPAQPDGTKTISPKVHLAGASFYLLGTAATVSQNAPDHYLNLGDELIGAATATPPTPPGPAPFSGYVIGSPEED